MTALDNSTVRGSPLAVYLIPAPLGIDANCSASVRLVRLVSRRCLKF